MLLTEQQKHLKSVIDKIKKPILETFIYNVHVAVLSNTLGLPTDKTSSGQNLHLKNFHAYLSSVDFEKQVKLLYTCSNLCQPQWQIARRIAFFIEKIFIKTKAQNLTPSEDKTVSCSSTAAIEPISDGKIRYIGGSVIGRLLHWEKELAVTHSHDTQPYKQNTSMQIIRYLEHLAGNHITQKTTKYPHTLDEIMHKQIPGKSSLKILSDDCFEFFCELEKKRKHFLTMEALHEIGTLLPGIVQIKLVKSSQLQSFFCDVFKNIFQTRFTQIRDFVDDIVQHSKVISLIYEKIINLYMKTGNKQFAIETKRKLCIKKGKAHRQQVFDSCGKSTNRKRKLKTSQQASKKARNSNIHVETIVEIDDNTCAECLQIYAEGELWLECDGCLKWLHRNCANCKTNKYWKLICNGKMPWLCPYCVWILDS